MYREQCSYILAVADFVFSKTSNSALKKTIRELCRIDEPNNIAIVNSAHIELIALQRTNWVAGLLWVLKMQSKELRKELFPFTHPFLIATEPFGEIMNAELQLWECCMDFIDNFPKNQWVESIEPTNEKNPLAGWTATSRERWASFCAEAPNYWTKESLVKKAREQYRQLNTGENPYSENYPHLHNLIALSLAISKREKTDSSRLKRERTKFLENGWKPYLKSQREWSQKLELDELMQIPNLKGGKLTCIVSGRKTETLFPLPPESFLKRSRKKNR